jgi:chromosome segregation ATPase
LEKRLAQVNAEGRQLQAQVERTKLNFDKSKEEARRLKVAAEAEYPLTDELRQKFSELPDGIEELDVEIQNLQVRADAVSPNRAVVDDYERRKQEIEKMTKDMEKEQQQLDVLQKELKDKTDEWLPQVEEIASEINKHFELFFEYVTNSCAL